MKKFVNFVVAMVLAASLAGCASAPSNHNSSMKISGSDVYFFPEPTIQIKVTRYSALDKTEFIIGPDVYDINDTSVMPILKWFHGLELEECEEPEPVDGNACYHFEVDGKDAFDYDSRGGDDFVIVNNKWYSVKNPSLPAELS